MRLCIVTGQFPGRSETFVTQHALGLAARGHSVTVVSEGAGEGIGVEELTVLESAGVRRVEIGKFERTRVQRGLRFLSRMIRCPGLFCQLFPKAPWTRLEMFQAWERQRVIRSIQSDVNHLHYGSLAGPLHRHGLPSNSLVTWHGYEANQLTRVRGEGMYRELFSGGYAHTVGSTFMRKKLEFLGADPELIHVIPMGIDLDRFSPVSRIPLAKTSRLKVVSVGRLDEMKGHRFLIEAVSRLLGDGLDIQLRIIGDGPLRAGLERQIAQASHGDRIVLTGAMPSEQVLDELHNAHLFALAGVVASTGRVETQGVVFAEAQATGLPVVACDVGGVSESLIDGETGILCPTGNVEAITDAIRSFIEEPVKLETFGACGRRFVEQRFSREKMLDLFERLYENQLKRSSSESF
jgi:colanic acid/amylovoran biosynthesis glycosyltransferase